MVSGPAGAALIVSVDVSPSGYDDTCSSSSPVSSHVSVDAM